MSANFQFFDAENYTSSLRCTIHRSGKMGFSEYTQDKLKFGDGMGIRVGIDGSKADYRHLLLQLVEPADISCFKLNKAGKYFYINPKPLLDELNINYTDRTILYEMVLVNEETKIYKLNKKNVRVQTLEE